MKIRFIDVFSNVLVALFTPIFFISTAAFIPCAFRPFYYWSIDPLGIPEYSGYSKAVIKEAFDDVLNYLWLNTPFKTGQLAFTLEEESHFADCKPLFYLQLILMIVGIVLFITYFVLLKTKVIKEYKILGFSPIGFGSLVGLSLLVIVGVWAAIDFDSLFVVFHHIAFPGKSNWTFDWNTEQIIRILPESFFMECAIFIVSLVIVVSLVFIIIDIVKIVKTKKLKKA